MKRRQFIKQSVCAGVGTATFFNSVNCLGMINTLAGLSDDDGEYKALVCILLGGGNDSFNMLIPFNDGTYQQYRESRSNLAIAKDKILPINENYGLHPSMPEIQSLFKNNQLAFIANVGTLVVPSTKEQVLQEKVKLPQGLLSHADQIKQWQTSVPQERNAKGWAGRMADILAEQNKNSKISMNISLSGTNIFQSGDNTTEYVITSEGNGSVGIEAYNTEELYQEVIKRGVENLLTQQYKDLFKQQYISTIDHAQDSHVIFNEALETDGKVSAQFPESEFGNSMKMVARTIAARGKLGLKKQVFFITYGGWDHHDHVLKNQVRMLKDVSQSLESFQQEINNLGLSENVTTFTISDFGRTLTSNGNGSDHAWGGNAMVMGGAVNGGKIYGKYPELYLESDLDIGDGILIPTTPTDLYYVELANWMGVPAGNMKDIFPNIGNFHDVHSNLRPLGFMK